MQHSIPKRTSSSGACSRPRPAPTQQTAKPTPALRGRQDRGRSHSARHYLFPKCQGPQPRSPWIKRFRSPSDQPGRKRRGLSLATAGPPRKQPLMCASPHSELGAEESFACYKRPARMQPVFRDVSTSRKVPPLRSKLSIKCWDLCQRLRQYFSWVCFTCDPSSSGWSRGFHQQLGVMDATA